MFFSSKNKEYTLSPTQELLLALLRAQLWLKPVDDIVLPGTETLDERRENKDDSSGHDSSSLVDEIHAQWNELLNLAYKQTVICFIAAACLRHKDVDKIPSDIKEELEAVIVENASIHKHHNEVLVELLSKFEEQGLHPILLKGQGLAQMYPQPELRQCGDFDLYFRPDEYDKAKSFIREIEDEGYTEEQYHHYQTRYKGIHIEIHRRVNRFYNPFVNEKYQKWTLESMNTSDSIVIEGKEVKVPSFITNYVAVFVHFWHHFEYGGVSLRQYCDVLMLSNRHKDIFEASDFLNLLKTFKIYDYCLLTISLFNRHFGSDFNILGVQNNIIKVNYMLSLSFFSGFHAIPSQKSIKGNGNWLSQRINNHMFLQKNIMSIYPISGVEIFWRFAAMKNFLFYRLICRLSIYTLY